MAQRSRRALAASRPSFTSSKFQKYQPFGQIPYIACSIFRGPDDEGFILYESRAICRYIAAKYPASGLILSDPKAHALFE
ncbi:hypothetical protein K438DRAFT_1989961 [Mycena galopus ATCC 62051]|nr:hypothetical protein K438DRAFT_1989961 [Mycena galopus ATCC 62051]